MERGGSCRRLLALSLAAHPFTLGFPSSGSDAACAAEDLTAADYSGLCAEACSRFYVPPPPPAQGIVVATWWK